MFHGLQREHFARWQDEKKQQELHDECQFARQQYIRQNESAWERYQQSVLEEMAANMPDTELQRLLKVR